MKKYLTKSEKQTIALGKKITNNLKGGEILALTGDLGAGKTTLIKGIAKGLGIEKIITSPTFVLMKIYTIKPKKSKIKILVHIDCYRITSAQEIDDIGALEYFNDANTVVVVEWADKIKKILPKKIININLNLGKNPDYRNIDINSKTLTLSIK